MSSGTPQEQNQQPTTLARAALYEWVFEQVDTANRQWLMDEINELALVDTFEDNAPVLKQLDIAFGFIPRRIEKTPLHLSAANQAQAENIIPGWCPGTWQLDEAARILLLASSGNGSVRSELIKRVARHADVTEQLAIFKGLCLHPVNSTLMNIIGDGLRSNVSTVFEAIAHHNPFPAAHFDDHQFNHMVLKAFFIESPLHPIVGLMERNNAELVRMCLEYASERTAAGRTVSWELWRLVAPLAAPGTLDKFKPLLTVPANDRAAVLSQKGLALALTDRNVSNTVESRDISWNALQLESTGT